MISSAKQRFWNLILQFFKRLNGIMLVLHRMSTDVSKSQSLRNNYGNELFQGILILILIFTKDAPSPRLNLSSLCWIGFSRMTFPGYLAACDNSIASFWLPNLSTSYWLHHFFLSKCYSEMEKKITFFKVESTFIEISISFFDHQPVSQCLCQKVSVLPKIALCCNDLPGASFSAC